MLHTFSVCTLLVFDYMTWEHAAFKSLFLNVSMLPTLGIFNVDTLRFHNYTATHRQNSQRGSCNGLLSIKQTFYLDMFNLNSIASKTLICNNNWLIKIDLEIIFLNKTLKMLGLCLIDGCSLQLSHHEFCLWVAA